MVFQGTPAAFDWVVLAVIGRVIGKLYGDAMSTDKVDNASHKLGAPTMIFRSIIQIEFEGGNSGGTWDRVRAAGGGLDTDAISSPDDAASSSGVEAPAPDLVVTLAVRKMGRSDGYGSEITMVPFSEIE